MKILLSRYSALWVEIDVGDGDLSVLCTSYQWFAPVAVDVHAASSMAACGSCIARYIYIEFYISTSASLV
jgi:hypothetical protein